MAAIPDIDDLWRQLVWRHVYVLRKMNVYVSFQDMWRWLDNYANDELSH